MIKVLFISDLSRWSGQCRALGCPQAWGCLHASVQLQGASGWAGEGAGEQLVREAVTALYPWACCSRGALFPSTGKFLSDLLKIISAEGFLLEVSQGHHGLFCLWALLRLLLLFLKFPLGWCPSLSSVLQPCLFNVVSFSGVGQEFKLLRNISRWFMDTWKGFIDFLAWKPFHNTEKYSSQLNKSFNELLLFEARTEVLLL